AFSLGDPVHFDGINGGADDFGVRRKDRSETGLVAAPVDPFGMTGANGQIAAGYVADISGGGGHCGIGLAGVAEIGAPGFYLSQCHRVTLTIEEIAGREFAVGVEGAVATLECIGIPHKPYPEVDGV